MEAQVKDSVSPVRRCADRGCHSCNLLFIIIEISFPRQWCEFKWILNPCMILIAYTLFITYARVGLTPLYSMLVLFADCWESKLITQVGLENLNGDLHQPYGIRYVLRSFSVRCFISLAYWEGIDFIGYSICCGTPQAIGSFLCNTKLWLYSIHNFKNSYKKHGTSEALKTRTCRLEILHYCIIVGWKKNQRNYT